MDFSELLVQRRSVRRYQDKPVPSEILSAVIKDSTLAPSSGNEQSWQFAMVTNKGLMARISSDCKKTLLERISRDPQDYAKKYETLLGRDDYNIFYNAPALVFILGDTQKKNSEINCTLAAAYFMFSAVTHGLGTCWISFGKFIRDKSLKDDLGLGPDHFIAAPIIIGYPSSVPMIPPRKPADIIRVID